MAKSRTLPIELDFRTGLPAYIQIVRRVERLMTSGAISSGDRLPTVRELAAQLGLNFNTTARAYRALHAAGLVTSERGRGTFVVATTSARGSTRPRLRLLQALADEYVRQSRSRGFRAAEIVRSLQERLAAEN